MDNQIKFDAQEAKSFDRQILFDAAKSAVMEEKYAPPIGINARMQKLRELSNLTQKDFAERVGVSAATWNTYERFQTPPWYVALRLIELIPGLDWNWIYGGDPRNLPVDLRRQLGEKISLLDA